MKVNAILFDIRSIQKYIFSGNKLKTNIGASYITCNLFQSLLVDEILTKLADKGEIGTFDKTSWKELETLEELPADTFVAQVGGGKALILFKKTNDEEADKQKLKNIIKEFNLKVLARYPGLHTGAAIGVIELNDFMNSEDKLFEKLKENQNTVYPIVNPPYTGLTLFCEVNGEAATYFNGHRWISKEVRAKEIMGSIANKDMQTEFKEYCNGKKFPLNLEDLGQKDGENYIAIIHIDGNKMGVKFRECKEKPKEKQFAAYNNLTKTVQKRTKEGFISVLKHIDENKERFEKELNLKKNYLPIRPLIFGGDDIAFVCSAKIALELTAVYMRELINGENSEKLYTCAGIAILSTSYPFFRGYQLSEQLCSEAKKYSRDSDPSKNSCWLDFSILHGEQSPTLSQIREEEYRGVLGDMHFGPYRVDIHTGPKSIDKLFECIRAFNNLPHGKIKEMRNVLAKNEYNIKNFLTQLKHTGKSIPHIDGWQEYEENLWHKEKTPYIDVIEMMDFTV